METTDGDTEQTEGNEICILCVENGAAEQNGMAILLLRLQMADGKGTDVSKGCDLNTLLALVCISLNGGNLQVRMDTLKKERRGNLGAERSAYQSLIKNRSEAFADTGNIHIVTNPVLEQSVQKHSFTKKPNRVMS